MMTNNEIERVEPLTGEITPAPSMLDRQTDSWIHAVAHVSQLANVIAHTEFVPRGLRGEPNKVMAAMLYGRELDLPPMASLASIDVIEGKPSLTAEMARALVLAAGHEIVYDESSSQRCIVRGRRKGAGDWTRVEWTMADASRAGLANKNNWKNHPADMLVARATSRLCRMVFADVTHGLGFAEEMADSVDDGAVRAPEPEKTSTVQRKRPTRKPSGPVTAPRAAAVDVPAMETPEPPQGQPEPAPVDVPIPGDEPLDIDGDTGEVLTNEPPKVSPAQLRMLGALWSGLGITDDQERKDYTRTLIGRDLAGDTTKDLTKREATGLIDTLNGVGKDRDGLDKLVADRIGGQQ